MARGARGCKKALARLRDGAQESEGVHKWVREMWQDAGKVCRGKRGYMSMCGRHNEAQGNV